MSQFFRTQHDYLGLGASFLLRISRLREMEFEEEELYTTDVFKTSKSSKSF